MISNKNFRSGQSLVEIMIGLGIGAVLIGAASLGITFMLRSSTSSQNFQKGGQLAEGLFDKVNSWSSANWQNIYGLTHGTSTQYFLDASGTALFAVQGQEGMLDNDVTNGLVGEWKFDEDPSTASTTINDSAGGGYNGSLSVASVKTSSTCEISNCLTFDGSSTYAQIPDYSIVDYDYNQNFSIAVWAKSPIIQTNTLASSNMMFEKWSGSGGYAYVFRIYNQTGGANAGKVLVARYDGTNNPVISSTQAYNDNKWHQFVFTKSSSTLYLYVDGVLNNSTLDTTTNTTLNSSPLYLARRGGVSPYYYQGFLDDLRIYNRSLTAIEISNLYKSTIFTRYFTVANVCRTNDASSSISGVEPCSGGSINDPSTQKVSVYTGWLPNNTGSPQMVLSNYITRWQNQAFVQGDWSGGAGQDGPFTSPGNVYSTSTNINTQSNPGSIKIFNLTP